MQPEIQSIADQLSNQFRQAEKDLDSIKIKPKVRRSARIRLSGIRAERGSGQVEVTEIQPLIPVFAVPHKRRKFSAQAKALFVGDIQIGETKPPKSPPQITIPIDKQPGVKQAA